MKAYSVTDANGDTGITYIIFAETRGSAIRYALDHCDGTFDWYLFTQMRALREPKLDKYHHGNREMDWCDMNDRIAMVKEAGFHCGPDVDITSEGCTDCPAHEWCDRYETLTEVNRYDPAL